MEKLKLLKKATKIGYIFRIPFASSSLWSEKKINFFSGMLGHPEGAWQGHAHFWQKLKLLSKSTKVGYFFQNSVCL